MIAETTHKSHGAEEWQQNNYVRVAPTVLYSSVTDKGCHQLFKAFECHDESVITIPNYLIIAVKKKSRSKTAYVHLGTLLKSRYVCVNARVFGWMVQGKRFLAPMYAVQGPHVLTLGT